MPIGFIGAHEYHVDDKGRVPLPPSFREKLVREGGVMSPSPDGCIVIYPLSEWEKLTEHQAAMSSATQKIRRLLRFYNSLSYPLVIDRQNRMTLPPALREEAGIEDLAMVNGAGTSIEVWSKKRWLAEKERVTAEAWQNLESLG